MIRQITAIYGALCALACIFATDVSYEGHRVYRLTTKSEEQLKVLRLMRDHPDVDFWTNSYGVGEEVDVRVLPEFQEPFLNYLRGVGIEYEVIIENVEDAVRAERIRQLVASRNVDGRIQFSKYNRYSEIQNYLYQLASSYPKIVSLENAGYSYEKRNLTVIKISSGGNEGNKPAIFVDGGIHAREWIAPAQVLYIIDQLVTNPENKDLFENVDWYLLPVLNPDGYEYSHRNKRLWRKTRRPGRIPVCYGTDANRNFDFHWLEVGASTNECSETYAGPQAFSEPEALSLSKFLTKYSSQIKLYLTFHSYGQYLLYPWGYTEEYPEDAAELDSLGRSVKKAIAAVRGTQYKVGSSTNVLYAAAGGSDDWAKGVAGIQLSYTIELPGGGTYGFDLPASDILPVVEETFEGIKVYLQYVQKKFA